jgi:hypothetical protein
MFPTPRNYRAAYLIKYMGGYTDKLMKGTVFESVKERNLLDFVPPISVRFISNLWVTFLAECHTFTLKSVR